MMRTKGASKVKYTPGCVIAVRWREPASRVTPGLERAKVAAKDRQWRARGCGIGDHERVVVAGDGEDRRCVIAEWFVELVVVILRFAEVVDDVAQTEKKS